MKAAVRPGAQRAVEPFRLVLSVADNQQTVRILQHPQGEFRDLVQPSAAAVDDLCPAEGRPQGRVIRNDLPIRILQRMRRRFEAGLCRRTEDDGRPADRGRKIDGKVKQRQQAVRDRLHFVDHDHAAAQRLKTADAGRLAGEECVEQLHQRREDDGAVPVFCKEFQLVEPFGCFICVHDVGVVLEDEPVVADIFADDLCVLLQNAQQRRCKNNAGFVPYLRVRQRVAQGTERFSGAGRHV